MSSGWVTYEKKTSGGTGKATLDLGEQKHIPLEYLPRLSMEDDSHCRHCGLYGDPVKESGSLFCPNPLCISEGAKIFRLKNNYPEDLEIVNVPEVYKELEGPVKAAAKAQLALKPKQDDNDPWPRYNWKGLK